MNNEIKLSGGINFTAGWVLVWPDYLHLVTGTGEFKMPVSSVCKSELSL